MSNSSSHSHRVWPVVGLLTVLLTACASVSKDHPVLYPNAAYKAMGEAAARQHMDQCVALARQSGLQPGDNAAASGAARGAAIAGVTGAVGSSLARGIMEPPSVTMRSA